MGFELDAFDVFVLAAMAAMLVLVCLEAKRHNDRIQTHGARVQGVIVRNKIQWGRIITVRPIVRFTTRDGQTVEALSEHGLAFAIPRYSEEATVTVVYNQENPNEFDIL
ncbi:DUF3592 domain-containing protein [Hymenobacter sp. BT491]|nr:DUF3592 domain-containing protein [Hymenobacter sp. BT491]